MPEARSGIVQVTRYARELEGTSTLLLQQRLKQVRIGVYANVSRQPDFIGVPLADLPQVVQVLACVGTTNPKAQFPMHPAYSLLRGLLNQPLAWNLRAGQKKLNATMA